MAIRKLTSEFVSEFSSHRVWDLIRYTKSKGKSEFVFHYPVSQLATQRYQRLKLLLGELGYTTTEVPNNATIPMRIGVLHIGNVQKAKLL